MRGADARAEWRSRGLRGIREFARVNLRFRRAMLDTHRQTTV
jgi:hypothetical protein